jgi:hypothetical protein
MLMLRSTTVGPRVVYGVHFLVLRELENRLCKGLV